MTGRLYHNDCYLAKFEASVVKADGSRVYLDRTAFYPASGGQPHDYGTISGAKVLEVVDEGDRIAHLVDQPVRLEIVPCEVDWPRRYDHMQQHTGQHLLSAVLEREFEWKTLSFHLGPEVSTIELSTPHIAPVQMLQAVRAANEFVSQNRPVCISYEQNPKGLRKITERNGEVRIVSIEGLDRSACGGTHVRSTAEVGPILLRRTERIRGNTRLEFVCGTRALERAQADFSLLSELTRATAVRIEKLPEHVEKVQTRVADAEKERRNLGIELARVQGAQLYREIQADGDGLRRLMLNVVNIDEPVRSKLQAFVAGGKALAVAATDASVAVFCSADSGLEAGAAVKSSGVRGGGNSTAAQGSLPNAEVLASLLLQLGMSHSQQN